MGAQPYSPSHGMVPPSKTAAPCADQVLAQPGQQVGGAEHAAVQQDVRLPALRDALARLGAFRQPVALQDEGLGARGLRSPRRRTGRPDWPR